MSPKEKVAKVLELAGVLAARYKAASQKQASCDESVANKIPQVVRTLISTGKLPEADGEKMAEVLRDPSKTLDVLINTARFRDATLGYEVPSNTKTASHERSLVVGLPGNDRDRYTPFGASRS